VKLAISDAHEVAQGSRRECPEDHLSALQSARLAERAGPCGQRIGEKPKSEPLTESRGASYLHKGPLSQLYAVIISAIALRPLR
jgi:hypothetical protein